MFKFDGLTAFVATVDAGSISAAAARLGLAKSVVSGRLAELERALGVTLIQRTTRKLSMTENGETFLPRARRILQEASEAESELAARSGTLVGPLRISAPVSFGLLHLAPALFRFLAEHPDVQLSLELDDRFVDPGAEGFDAAIRHGTVKDSRLVAKRLATSRRLLVASPDYVSRFGAPRTLGELGEHRAILYSNRANDWRFEADGGWVTIRPTPAFRVNNGLLMCQAAVAGLGITLLPQYFIHGQLASGELVPIEVGAEAEGAELFIIYPRDHAAAVKIQALVACLRDSFGDPPHWAT